MTASNRPDMTLEQIAERHAQAVVAHAGSMTAVRDAVRALDAEADAEAVLADAFDLTERAKRASKAAFSILAWGDQLRASLNLAFVRGDLTDEQCREFLADWEPDAQMRRDRTARAS